MMISKTNGNPMVQFIISINHPQNHPHMVGAGPDDSGGSRGQIHPEGSSSGSALVVACPIHFDMPYP